MKLVKRKRLAAVVCDPMYISHVAVYIGNRKMGCPDQQVQRGAKTGVGIDDVGPRA